MFFQWITGPNELQDGLEFYYLQMKSKQYKYDKITIQNYAR